MPTLEELEALAPGQGHALDLIISGAADPLEYDSVALWVKRCLNRPAQHELKMAAINEILDGFGVEAIFGASIVEPDAEYINLGDPYEPTIVFDCITDEYRVMSWGDWVEERELAGFIVQ